MSEPSESWICVYCDAEAVHHLKVESFTLSVCEKHYEKLRDAIRREAVK